MSQKLPLHWYKWDNIEKITSHIVKNYHVIGDQGYLLEVDVKYPEKMRVANGELAFLPEQKIKYLNTIIKSNMMILNVKNMKI